MLEKNKALVILIIFVLLLGLCACSGSSQEQIPPPVKESDNQTVAQAQGNTENITADSQGNQDSQLSISVGDDVGKSAELPDGYPSDLFPIYKDSYIISAVELEGSYTIAASSKDDFKEVAAFYKEVLKSATVTMETDSDTGFTSFGTINNYTYNFDTGASKEIEGYASSITIMLMPAN